MGPQKIYESLISVKYDKAPMIQLFLFGMLPVDKFCFTIVSSHIHHVIITICQYFMS